MTSIGRTSATPRRWRPILSHRKRRLWSESQEMQLAADLMEVQSEEEFENFLDDLIGGIAKAAGGFLNSSAGKALGGLLKGAAKKLLPLAGTAIGGYFGGPAGASIGGNIAGTLSGSLEMEQDEMEWEAARTFVRLAADAAKNAALSPPGETPEDTAHQAVATPRRSTRRRCSCLLSLRLPCLRPPCLRPQGSAFMPQPSIPPVSPMAPHCPVCGGGHRSGRWSRRGNHIVLFGI